MRLRRQARLQSISPCDSQFGVDVNNVDSGSDRPLQISIIGSRSAVQSKRNPSRRLDLSDSLNIQAFPLFSLHHLLGHAVHVAHGGSQHIDSREFNKLFRFCWSGQIFR